MKASHNLAAVAVTFDEDHLVPNAGLALPALLAQRLAVAEEVDRRVKPKRPGRANSGAKAMTVLGAMLAGGSHIDHVDVLRCGAAPELFDDTRAPSTIGTWLRCFSWGTVRALDAVTRVMLARAWAAGLGPPELTAPLTIDIDSSIARTYGTAKQGGVWGHTKVRGYHPLLATLADTGEVLHTRMRGGNAHSGRGAVTFLRETLSRVRQAGATGPLTVRADSAFYNRSVIAACVAADVRFSITVKLTAPIRRAIAAIPDDAWQPIPYWIAGGADVAEVPYTLWPRSAWQRHVRLVVRRVRPTPGSQLALDVVFDHHAFVTDRADSTLAVEDYHRDHAVIELVIRDLKDAGWAHLPSGKFAANAAWSALACLAHNLGKWTLRAAGPTWATATSATLRRCITGVPARLVSSARRRRLRMPTDWPWQNAILAARQRLAAIPAPG